MKKRPARTKLWQILKKDTNAHKEIDNGIFDFAKKIDQNAWLKGYREWQKTNQKLKDHT